MCIYWDNSESHTIAALDLSTSFDKQKDQMRAISLHIGTVECAIVTICKQRLYKVKKQPQDGDSRQTISNLCMVMHLGRIFAKLLMRSTITKIVVHSHYDCIVKHGLF